MKRHSLDPFSLVFGTVFAILGGLFLFARTDIEDLHLKWIWPVPLIVLGALIISLSIRENRSDREIESSASASPEIEDEAT